MGAVYEAVQEALGRRVALKVLSQKLVENPTALARFQREARAAAAMNHPNIIQVYDIGEDQGYHYFAMEFVDGETLLGRLQREGRLPWQDALAIGEGVAKALQYAHQHSFIHRDIKPENIMVSRDGTIKLADLGLAKNVEDQHGVTATGTGLGTPYYMAPEQGMDAAHVDHRADIYALGITLLHTMTGRRPYDGKSALQIVRQHMERPLPSGLDLGTDLPKDVDDLIHRMCAKDKAERHADYAELIADMERVRTGKAAPAEKDVAAAEPQAAPAPEPVPVAARAPRKSKTPWIIAAAVAAVVIVGVVVFLILRSRGG
jgi:serine/threonine-protein kinase